MLNLRREGRVAIIELDRPERLNALSDELHHALSESVAEVADDPAIGCVVLTGAGRAFCSGGDTGSPGRKAEGPITQERRAARIIKHAQATKTLHEMCKPTLAVVNGPAAGAGLALALACDMRIAASDAIMTTAYARIALPGDFGCTYFLTRLVGPAMASELMFMSEKIDMARAHQIGLVNRVVEPARLMDEGLEMARIMAEMPPVTIGCMKRNIRAAQGASFDEMIEREALAMVRCTKTQDAKEALAARREKRAPVFVGY